MNRAKVSIDNNTAVDGAAKLSKNLEQLTFSVYTCVNHLLVLIDSR